jgi:hypothetical protein
MKTTTFIFALLISVSAFASDKYTEQMSKHIHAVYTAKVWTSISQPSMR